MTVRLRTSCRWVQQYGGIVRFYHLLGREQVLIADPDALRQILVTHAHKYTRVSVAGFLEYDACCLLVLLLVQHVQCVASQNDIIQR